MASQADTEIALARIAAEAEQKTGTLDLRDLELAALPPEIARLAHLRELAFGVTKWWKRGTVQVDDLAPIAGLQSLQSLDCSGTQVDDLAPIAGLQSLQSLDCSTTGVADLKPLKDLISLQSINCTNTQVVDLTPLIGLHNLQSLYCSITQVADLTPLKGLKSLQSIECAQTGVADLKPLKDLIGLQSINCSDTQVATLTPLKGLNSLQSIECAITDVADLTPLKGLKSLQSLNCSETQVVTLAPLKGLYNLRIVDFSLTRISDLTPLRGLKSLQHLYCIDTDVADLTPLRGLKNLQYLHCHGTNVVDLAPIAGLSDLAELFASNCSLSRLSRDLVSMPSLRKLVVSDNHVPGIPNGILSENPLDDCLERLRAHFADMDCGEVEVGDVKLFLLGNGGVGKTQIARRLLGKPFDTEWDSTHGIRMDGRPRPGSIAERLHLKLWDFGGQDIYHGTHALFLGSPAITVIVWAPEFDNRDTYVHDGLTFRNHPLAYWLALVRQHGGPHSPVLVVQTRCDEKKNEAKRLPIDETALDAFAYSETALRVSSKADRGFAHFEETVADAITWMRAPERLGTATIGAGRLRVQRRLEAMRAEDSARPPAERQHRLLDRAGFDRICAEEGGVSDTGALLHYLNANGVVLWRPQFLPDTIVLDQAWVLEAIYTVLDREKVVKWLRGNGGRFTRDDLGLRVWQDHSLKEQELFVSMMRASGMCFLHRRFRATDGDDGTDRYIAPDCLQDRREVETSLEGLWDETADHEWAVFRYDLLHGGLIRSIIAEIGELAGVDALYWRGGVCGFDVRRHSRFIVEEVMTGDWAGEIRVRSQRGDAAALLDTLVEMVEQVQGRWSIRPAGMERSSARRAEAVAKLEPGLETPKMTEWYVSYAWGDTTPEGIAREKIVDDLCDAAAKRGSRILRDKNEIGFGESISAFMRRLGGGDRIFVILSDKYLQSPACMFELHEIWRQSRQDGRAFLDRVRVYTMEGTKVWTTNDRLKWALHWKERHDETNDLATKLGHTKMGEAAYRELRLMNHFADQVADILSILTDIRQPRSFEDLERYGFDDPPTA